MNTNELIAFITTAVCLTITISIYNVWGSND
jgi:hypothetical protein